MPTALIDLPIKTDPPRKRWTREEYEQLSHEVVNWERLELVDGELITKMGKNRSHVNAMIMLRMWLESVFGAMFINTEAPIDVAPADNPTSEPEPDIMVLSRDTRQFKDRMNPAPADLLLVVEVSSTTLGFDLTAKAQLYARAGIQDYWVLDVEGRRTIVHRRPSGGRYESVIAYSEDEPVAPLASPGSELRATDLFDE